MFVEVKNMNFGYTSERLVFKDISFDIEKSKTLGILGVSGSGKSTLMRVLSGLLLKEKSNQLYGKILINGLSPAEYRKQGKLSFMFQETALMPNLTVRSNITLPLMIRNMVFDNKILEDIIETVGLSDFQDYLPNKLSGGMKARVELARSFIIKPELLLLDEPFSSLDVGWKSKIFEELQLLEHKYNTTAIIVTHDIKEAMDLSDNVMVLSAKGNIIKNLPLNNHTNKNVVLEELREIVIHDHYKYYDIE